MSSVSPVSGVPGAGAGTATGADRPTTQLDGANAQLDRTAFLKLLVAQLKFQDPTNPADTSQMLTQSAQLTMVDRLNEIATQLGTSGTSQQLSLASSIVGKEVSFLDAGSVPRTAVVQSARLDGNELVLTAGGFTVPIGAVTSIGNPAPQPAPQPAAAGAPA